MDAPLIRRLRSEIGTTLIETCIASAILLVVMVGLLSMGAIATTFTENHGHLEARTTEYAQDKLEQLLTLSFKNSSSNTVTFPTTDTGGTGLLPGGSTNTASPQPGYVDWLDNKGNILGGVTAAPSDWFYERVWEICYLQSDGTCITGTATGLKRITVSATVKAAVGKALIPKSTIAVLKSSDF